MSHEPGGPSAVCGLPLTGADGITQPLAALVIIKYFDPDAEESVSYRALATGGLSTVEALGMADYAVLRLRTAIAGGSGGTGP